MLEGIWYGITAAFVFIGVISSAYIKLLYMFLKQATTADLSLPFPLMQMMRI